MSGAGAFQPTQPISESGARWVLDHPRSSIGIGDRERLGSEGDGHELGLTCFDLTGGYEHEPNLAAGVDNLESAVLVAEGGAIRVVDRDVLGEGDSESGLCQLQHFFVLLFENMKQDSFCFKLHEGFESESGAGSDEAMVIADPKHGGGRKDLPLRGLMPSPSLEPLYIAELGPSRSPRTV
ncbi:hypothetical protein DVH24_003523 [Malus domestica]|uniref:Uncharacterized protein n=1 Tax=Malus domestica TaxID=3750 RepID=A0A498ILK2_MALDO|nr:hypothetical protein DVH24_003523 [Malus domestica]